MSPPPTRVPHLDRYRRHAPVSWQHAAIRANILQEIHKQLTTVKSNCMTESAVHGKLQQAMDGTVTKIGEKFVDYKFFQVGCTRRNIYQRDNNTCQYCRQPFPLSKLTLDHVIPKSRGGGKSWNNLVASCMKCNQRKGNRLPKEAGMQLLKPPFKPRYKLLDYLGPVHELWKPYLAGFYTK